VGAGSAAAALRRALNGKSIDSRPIRVIELKLVPDPNCCDAIYFATDKTAELSAALAAVARGEVLTIGESRDFLKLGGALNLLMVDGHMSFEVGLDALTQSHVGISSKLLRFGQLRGRKGGAT
jgi:prepilin-type processing-associated H-X9-DG protein